MTNMTAVEQKERGAETRTPELKKQQPSSKINSKLQSVDPKRWARQNQPKPHINSWISLHPRYSAGLGFRVSGLGFRVWSCGSGTLNPKSTGSLAVQGGGKLRTQSAEEVKGFKQIAYYRGLNNYLYYFGGGSLLYTILGAPCYSYGIMGPKSYSNDSGPYIKP